MHTKNLAESNGQNGAVICRDEYEGVCPGGAAGKVAVSFERLGFLTEHVSPQWTGSLASAELANDVARCFTFRDGGRALDCAKAFRRVRKALGTNFDFAFGFPASEDFKLGIADKVGEKVRDFVLNGTNPGVGVSERADGGKTLVVATGERSRRFDIPVFIRLDVHPLNLGPKLVLDHLLLTDGEGSSIAGLADIPERICDRDLRHADRAFREVLGRDFNVLGVNASLYSAWDEAHANALAEFTIDLSAFQETRECGTCICRFKRQLGSWDISFVLAGEEWTLGELAGEHPELVADPKETERAVDAIRNSIARLSQDDSKFFLDFRHLFDARHLSRFSDGFAELARKNPSAAKRKVLQTLRRELSSRNCEEWIPFFYHSGFEKHQLAGAEIDSEVALLIPLYLTDEDCAPRIPSTYLVACLNEDSDGHRECVFPTILSGRQAEMNSRYFRRAVRNGLRVA
jgi:hypothetical protein